MCRISAHINIYSQGIAGWLPTIGNPKEGKLVMHKNNIWEKLEMKERDEQARILAEIEHKQWKKFHKVILLIRKIKGKMKYDA